MDINALSPEERLNIFARWLVRRDPRALEIFSMFSGPNQLLTFLQSAPFRSTNEIARIGEYVVIKCEDLSNDSVFVIGLDENYMFFCHRLPLRGSEINLEILTERDIRNLMGFDYHCWEMAPSLFRDGIRVRFQGDVVLNFLRVFSCEEELYLYLILDVFFEVANISISLPQRVILEIRRRMKALINRITGPNGDDIDVLKELLKGIYVVPQIHCSAIRSKTISIIKNIHHLEHRLNIVIGNHRIQILGVRGIDVIRSFNIRDPNLDDRRSVLVLRPHEIIALHDEHKVARLQIPRSVIRIETLESSTLQVTRERVDQWPRSRSMIMEKIDRDIESIII